MSDALSAGSVSIGVKPDTSKFGSDLKTGLMGGVNGVGENLGKKLLAGLAVVGIGTSIADMFKTGFSELKDAQAGTAQLAAGIKSTGNAANVSVKGMNDLASSIQAYSGQTDDSIVKTESLLLTFTNIKNAAGANNDVFNQATKAAADMAARMGGDASGAAIQLGKALNDPVKGITALSRVGVSFTEQQKAQIKSMVASNDVMGAQKIILGELNKEFGGSAAAYGQTLPGMIDRLKRSYEDLTQTLMTAFLPIINPIVDALLGMFKKVQPVAEAFGTKLSAMFAGLADGSLSFKDAIKNISDGVANFVSGGGLQKMLDGFNSFRSKLLTAIIEILPSIIDGLAQTLVKVLPPLVKMLLGMLPQILQAAQTLFMALVQAVITIVPPLLNALVNMLPKIVTTIINMLPKLIDTAITLFNALIDGLVRVIPPLLQALIAALPKILDALVKMLPALIQGAVKLFVGLVTGLLKVLPDLIKAVMGLVPVIVKTLIQMMPLLIDAGIQILKGLTKGIIDNAPAILGMAVRSIGSALIDGVKALLGIKSPSRVFMEIGGHVTDGLANGLIAGKDGVVSAAGRVTADMVDRVRETLTTLKASAEQAVTDAKKALADYAQSVKDNIGGLNFGQALTDEQQAKQDATQQGKTFGGSFIQSLQAQADQAVKFTDDIKKLVAGGLSKDALQQVLQAGQTAGDQIAQELLDGGSTTIKQANDLIEATKSAASAAADAAAGAYYAAGVKNAEDQVAGYTARLAALGGLSGVGAAAKKAATTASNTSLADRAAAGVPGAGATTIIYNAARNDSISSEQKLTDAVNRAAVLARTGGL